MDPELLQSLLRRHARKLQEEAERKPYARGDGPAAPSLPLPGAASDTEQRPPMPAKFSRAPVPPYPSPNTSPAPPATATSAAVLLGADGRPLRGSIPGPSPAEGASAAPATAGERKTVVVDLRAASAAAPVSPAAPPGPKGAPPPPPVMKTTWISSPESSPSSDRSTSTSHGEGRGSRGDDAPAVTMEAIAAAAKAAGVRPTAPGRLGVQVDEVRKSVRD